MKRDINEKLARYDRENAIAARIILSDPVRYAGAQTLFARMFMDRHERGKINVKKSCSSCKNDLGLNCDEET